MSGHKVILPSNAGSNPRRRWYQFSLRTLLLVMLVFAIVVGWVGSRMYRARVNRERVATSEKASKEAVAEMEKLGGTVTYAYETRRPQTWLEEVFDDPGDADDPVGVFEVTKVEFVYCLVTDADLKHLESLTDLQVLDLGSNADIGDAGMEHLKGLTSLQTLILLDNHVTDAGLVHLKGMTELKELDLYGTDATDAGLEHLKGLTKLQSLYLPTQVTDAGLEKLQGLTNLQYLFLACQVTDAGLEHLQGLANLQLLHLPYQVTDAGLKHLTGMTNLKELYVDKAVTDEGIASLQKALPNCKIERIFSISF